MEPPSGEQGSSPVSTQFNSTLQDTSWELANRHQMQQYDEMWDRKQQKLTMDRSSESVATC